MAQNSKENLANMKQIMKENLRVNKVNVNVNEVNTKNMIPVIDTRTMIDIVKKINKTQGNIYSAFSFLPWFIVFVSLYIIVAFLIKIETNSLDNWEIGKCSSKYVFFSGFMNNQGKDPMQASLDNFQECVKRFL